MNNDILLEDDYANRRDYCDAVYKRIYDYLKSNNYYSISPNDKSLIKQINCVTQIGNERINIVIAVDYLRQFIQIDAEFNISDTPQIDCSDLNLIYGTLKTGRTKASIRHCHCYRRTFAIEAYEDILIKMMNTIELLL